MVDRGKKRTRKYKNLNISKAKRAFFILFEGLSFGEKEEFDEK